ncbi:unnamed protein product [Rotaria magnacalcarata]|uniref:Uncharacterized protein n=1 Tax=Rotaria magnacalcarata TaxID=392030 RepID=A0A816RGM6_9BILA|nr:unnamed protein product [Rotaria magnacalcarata]CAF1374167.1 unnamed protein product [Rotaria magnacalcarata]CAF2073122.1 unnamed protein product [Rotaria magnacalcarata]CAF4382035.1 unnamed protein product [Rotaria magnacalcarata]CAF4638848.1 unnamed protein product [Rotaria magnacalcarata]
METTSTQPGNMPSEPSLNNDQNETQIDQIVYPRIVNLSQSSILPMNTGNMIPSQIQTNTTDQQDEILRRRREGRRRRRQRRAQRRREQRAIEQAQRQPRQQQRRLYPRGRSQQRRHERYQRWLERLEQQQQDPNRQPTNYHPRIVIPGDYDYFSGEDDQENLLEAYEREIMTTQQRRDQIEIMQFEGFAALEQLLLVQDEREQSQQIRDMQAFDEERQQEFNRFHNWEQQRLLDYEENRNTLVDEPNDDDPQQLHQIDMLARYDIERQRQAELNDNWDQTRLNEYLRNPTPSQSPDTSSKH